MIEVRRTLEDIEVPNHRDEKAGAWVRPSIHDVPTAIMLEVDPHGRTAQLTFEYIDNEDEIQEHPDRNLIVGRGYHSGKILRVRLLEVHPPVVSPQLIAMFKRAIQRERGAIPVKRMNQEMNSALVTGIIEHLLNRMLELASPPDDLSTTS